MIDSALYRQNLNKCLVLVALFRKNLTKGAPKGILGFFFKQISQKIEETTLRVPLCPAGLLHSYSSGLILTKKNEKRVVQYVSSIKFYFDVRSNLGCCSKIHTKIFLKGNLKKQGFKYII